MSVHDGDGDKARAAGRMQAIYRDVNERIVELADDDASVTIICECCQDDCADPIAVPQKAYDAVRADRRRFIVKDGHIQPKIERVLERHDGFMVIEKFGPAGQVVEDDTLTAA
jgi:hypothetical protein